MAHVDSNMGGESSRSGAARDVGRALAHELVIVGSNHVDDKIGRFPDLLQGSSFNFLVWHPMRLAEVTMYCHNDELAEIIRLVEEIKRAPLASTAMGLPPIQPSRSQTWNAQRDKSIAILMRRMDLTRSHDLDWCMERQQLAVSLVIGEEKMYTSQAKLYHEVYYLHSQSIRIWHPLLLEELPPALSLDTPHELISLMAARNEALSGRPSAVDPRLAEFMSARDRSREVVESWTEGERLMRQAEEGHQEDY